MLSVRNLSVTFTLYDVGLVQKQLTPIIDLDLDVAAGELVAVVGSSGSGKSLLAHAILGILPNNAVVGGEMIFKGEPLTARRQATLRGREIALIPQAVSFLDPLQRVGPQVKRAAELSGLSAREAARAQARAFQRYGLAEETAHLFPFQISGGMARRVLLATATVGNADLIIADEPTPGLHPEAVRETLAHLRELADEGKAVALITHDIEAALGAADKIAVFYAGTALEVAHVDDFRNGGQALRHPYTRALWRALPQNDFEPVPGAQPPPDALPQGCLYVERCPMAIPTCREYRPSSREVGGGRVRCFRV